MEVLWVMGRSDLMLGTTLKYLILSTLMVTISAVEIPPIKPGETGFDVFDLSDIDTARITKHYFPIDSKDLNSIAIQYSKETIDGGALIPVVYEKYIIKDNVIVGKGEWAVKVNEKLFLIKDSGTFFWILGNRYLITKGDKIVSSYEIENVPNQSSTASP